MSKKRNIRLRSIILVAMTTVLAILFPMQVYASEAKTAFGSNYYVVRAMEKQLRIGVYIRADEVIGEYHLELRYDNTRLKYVSGADTEEDGLLILEGTGKDMKVFFYFEAISGGEAGSAFTGAQVYNTDGRELLDITEFDYAPITIQGEDASGISFVELLQKAENPEENIEDEIDNSESPSMKEEDSAEIPVMAEEGGAVEEVSADVQVVEKENKSSAAQIYEQSKQLAVVLCNP